MSTSLTLMAQEARDAPQAVARFLAHNRATLAEIGKRLQSRPPPGLLTSARGSSDHAASYFKYLAEIQTGVPCASIGASVVSVYGTKLKAKGFASITISQSGQSPDIVALQEAARKAGALTIAIINVEDSPAARSADICLPLCAGQEKSVAATKSFITSLAAGAAIIAAWAQDDTLSAALHELPERLEDAARIEWSEIAEKWKHADSLYVLGRGPSLPIAGETALKLKETCAIHAEAYSIAEVMHGPLELLGRGFPVFAYVQPDRAQEGSRKAIERMLTSGADILHAGEGGLRHARTAHPLLDPISMIQTAYLAIEALARARGRDPDKPLLLKKVTETL
jgi:glutamine---fructose-6-phosphate transaminase (isomerizing)